MGWLARVGGAGAEELEDLEEGLKKKKKKKNQLNETQESPCSNYFPTVKGCYEGEPASSSPLLVIASKMPSWCWCCGSKSFQYQTLLKKGWNGEEVEGCHCCQLVFASQGSVRRWWGC